MIYGGHREAQVAYGDYKWKYEADKGPAGKDNERQWKVGVALT